MKQHCRLSQTDTTHDLKLYSLIDSANELLEADTGIVCLDSDYNQSLNTFPESGLVLLSRRPLIGILSVEYTDTDGASQTLDPSHYKPDLWRRGIIFQSGLPSVSMSDPNAVQIKYNCGYDTAQNIPGVFKEMMLLRIGRWFRDPTDSDQQHADLTAYEILRKRFIRSSYP